MAERPDIGALPDDALPSVQELPGDLRQLAEIIVVEVGSERAAVRVVLRIVQEFRGTYIYCRGLDEWERAWRDKKIREEFDSLTRGGVSARQAVTTLARRYPVGDRQIWTILGRPDDRQMSLF
jgi:Mor family transcriptional regulator